MNLPHLFLADLPPEAVLTPTLVRDACIAIKRNRATWLAARPTQELVELLAYAAERWLQPDNGFRLLALRQAPTELGIGAATLSRGLDGFLRQLTVEGLHALLLQDLGDTRRLDEFCGTPGELRQGRTALARGPELLAHFAAGNLPNSSLMSLVLGVLTKSAQFFKLSARSSLVPRLFAHSLADLEPKLARCLEMATWPGGTVGLEDALLQQADTVVVLGSDDTVSAVRSRVGSHARFLGYGHRLSFGFVGSDVLSGYMARKIAARAAADVTAWNQLGCLSPHVIYVEERGSVSAEGFAAMLAEALAEREQTEPRGELPVEEAAEIRTRRSLHEVRARRHLQEREGAETVPRGPFFDPPGHGTRVWSSEESTAWTVIYEDDIGFRPSCLNRFVYVKPCPDLARALQAAEVMHGRVSTVGVAANEGRMQELAVPLARWGVTRVCPLGRMQEPPLTWRHDGRPALADLITWTDLELGS
jgi:Acyl-CoA reductase (LuxC)